MFFFFVFFAETPIMESFLTTLLYIFYFSDTEKFKLAEFFFFTFYLPRSLILSNTKHNYMEYFSVFFLTSRGVGAKSANMQICIKKILHMGDIEYLDRCG